MEKEVKATYQDGVLVVHLPKVAPAVASKILIK
jgi:HSP20 family molecular chaperone IbpA